MKDNVTQYQTRNWLRRAALSPRRWTATFTCALTKRARFHFRVHFAGNVDKDCLDREGHEGYEVHSPSQGGLMSGGGARVPLSHGEAQALLQHGQLAHAHAHAHSTTPHLAGPSAGAGSPQYRALMPEHEPSPHYAPPQPTEPRPSVIESSQPLIIECTWARLQALPPPLIYGRVFPRRYMWFRLCDQTIVLCRTSDRRSQPPRPVALGGYEIMLWTLRSCTCCIDSLARLWVLST